MSESIPAGTPATEPIASTPLEKYRVNNPQYGGMSDVELAKGLYNQGGFAREGESLADFSTRAGVQAPQETPAAPAPEPTPLQKYRQNNPQYQGMNDLTLARGLYEQGGFSREGETFEDFATRAGIQVSPIAAAANRAATTVSFGADKPVQASLAGLLSLIEGKKFDEGYTRKRQQIDDGLAVGAHQNPISDTAGNVLGYTNLWRGPVAAAVHGGAAALPVVGKMIQSSPLASAVVKAFGLGGAQEIPKVIEREVQNPNGPDFGKAATDVGTAALTDGATAFAGGGLSKALTSVGSIPQAVDKALSGIPVVSALSKLVTWPTRMGGAVLRGIGEPSRMLPRAAREAVSGMPSATQQGGRLIMDDRRNPANAPALFPDSYNQPPQPEKRSELDTKRLAEADPQDVVRHVAERISPEVARQIADAGESGYGAAMFSLMSQPQYRQALSANPEGQSNAA